MPTSLCAASRSARPLAPSPSPVPSVAADWPTRPVPATRRRQRFQPIPQLSRRRNRRPPRPTCTGYPPGRTRCDPCSHSVGNFCRPSVPPRVLRTPSSRDASREGRRLERTMGTPRAVRAEQIPPRPKLHEQQAVGRHMRTTAARTEVDVGPDRRHVASRSRRQRRWLLPQELPPVPPRDRPATNPVPRPRTPPLCHHDRSAVSPEKVGRPFPGSTYLPGKHHSPRPCTTARCPDRARQAKTTAVPAQSKCATGPARTAALDDPPRRPEIRSQITFLGAARSRRGSRRTPADNATPRSHGPATVPNSRSASA